MTRQRGGGGIGGWIGHCVTVTGSSEGVAEELCQAKEQQRTRRWVEVAGVVIALGVRVTPFVINVTVVDLVCYK